jgi:hypothetical protein
MRPLPVLYLFLFLTGTPSTEFPNSLIQKMDGCASAMYLRKRFLGLMWIANLDGELTANQHPKSRNSRLRGGIIAVFMSFRPRILVRSILPPNALTGLVIDLSSGPRRVCIDFLPVYPRLQNYLSKHSLRHFRRIYPDCR